MQRNTVITKLDAANVRAIALSSEFLFLVKCHKQTETNAYDKTRFHVLLFKHINKTQKYKKTNQQSIALKNTLSQDTEQSNRIRNTEPSL